MVERLRPGRFAAALLERVDDAVLATLPCIGGIDQYVDSADVLSRPELTRDITMAACPTGDLS
ncbi:hypothetical protein GCM10025331_80200 [Actinoplanes utahensis]|uniref:Uncharacterized protein n=2 Tax=Actinoplanes utahensis TaxID=1869 RepID=A0A0A6UGV8_ACTUT|nr:hypothetical protein MB27_34125 [Actinoplanes utahensis]GIF33912.1 hypothetical protein Aut01nite_68980 [Actinoplanes utahensis]